MSAVISVSLNESGRYLHERKHGFVYASLHTRASSFINTVCASSLNSVLSNLISLHYSTGLTNLLTSIGLPFSSHRIGPVDVSGSPQQCMRLEWLLLCTPVV